MHTEHCSRERDAVCADDVTALGDVTNRGLRYSADRAHRKALWRRNAHDGGALEGQGQCAPP